MTNPAVTPLKPTTMRVLLPLPLGDGYDYLPINGEKTPVGTIIDVPLGKKHVFGVVWGDGDGTVPLNKLKSMIAPYELPLLPSETRQFVDWVAQYTVNHPGAILKMVFGGTRLIRSKKNDDYACPQPLPDFHQPSLSESQQAAASTLIARVKDNKYSATLLDGVTGAGKTEVFCEAIAECLRQGKQALVLLPEIAMTAVLINRFAARFGVKPVEWHSELTEKQRRLNWHAIIHGEAKFILGARSALFLPYPKLGLIVVDEEHEAAYKQEEGATYHGRDMAVVRAHIGNIPVVLSSATPSLETVLSSRFGNAVMPKIATIDIRQHKMSAQSFLTPPLFEALKQTVTDKKQAMLFLNRRGYAPLTLCRACGHRMKCPNCTSWLIHHMRSSRLQCHHCDYSIKEPNTCPACGAEDKFAACGPGVERVAEEVRTRLPDARIAIMASDTLDGPKAAQALVDQMTGQELDILIGTQIMAKGYHFPRLTLVGVVDADLGLSGGDPRAAERTFQLLQQVSGRSGRADDPGQVLLQTTSPDHPVMKALLQGDRDAFMAAELRERDAYNLPPHWRLAHITVSGADTKLVIKLAEHIALRAPQNDQIRVLGPAPAPFAMLRGQYRHRLLVQTPRNINLSQVIRDWLAHLQIPRTLRVIVDIDPYSFL